MLKEIVDCFGKGVIHCGGDEPLGLTEVFGVEEGGKLFIEHYTFIHDELAKLGCTLMMYADFFAPPWGDYAVPVDRAKELLAIRSLFFGIMLRGNHIPLSMRCTARILKCICRPALGHGSVFMRHPSVL